MNKIEIKNKLKIAKDDTMEQAIEKIIDACDALDGDETLCVEDFGKHNGYRLDFWKDTEFDKRDPDYSNLVDIVTIDKVTSEPLDDACGIYVTDGALWGELERIWNGKDLMTL